MPPPVVSWLVVSLVLLKPGTFAPAAPVAVESPDSVEGLPLHDVNAKTVTITKPMINLPIVVVDFFIFVMFIELQTDIYIVFIQ